jgi:hypothetical protein
MRWKPVLPWRYVVMLVIGLAVLWALIARFGRTDAVLIGWVIGWLVISRAVDFVIRRRRKHVRFDREGD